ncbi:hypothetical protein K435DRAFT_963182 [Dendrothele bispora CBS 962.96]|uniref:Uncharacterized protein n=1 Tax=Dendrothele bispora (strain CBS 962.96) TaxID=1314807 RepID=A0A4S8MHV1_DENBC|nr:hypothetical protein K435DRAFT_963182 [Dendrothele bispora CBS 962.96]
MYSTSLLRFRSRLTISFKFSPPTSSLPYQDASFSACLLIFLGIMVLIFVSLPPHPLSAHPKIANYKMGTFFTQASQFSIQGQTINFVAGDQNTRIHQVHTGDSDSIVSPGVLGTRSIFDDYREIRRGDLRLSKEISKEVVDENDYYYYYRRVHRLRAQKRLEFTRSAYRVQVIGQNLPHSVAVLYGGEDAQAAWERDFLRCSQIQHPNIAHLFGLTRSLFSPALVFYNDLIPVRQLWHDGSAIIRCYIAHRFRKDIHPLIFYNYFSSLVEDINPDTGLFCISPIHSCQDDFDTPHINWVNPTGPALNPLPVASYIDSSIMSHYSEWARHDISPELALQNDISSNSSLYSNSSLDHNPRQPVSLPVITTTPPTTLPTIIGKFKNLHYRVVDEELLHLSAMQKAQDLLRNRDKEMEVPIKIEKWRVNYRFVGQRNEPSSETDLKGWTSSGHILLENVPIVISNGCSPGLEKLAQYFCDIANGLYKDIQESAALLTSIRFFLEPNYKNHHSLLHPNFHKIFLFIAPITASHSSVASEIDVCWGNDDNDLYYWSLDPDGSCPLSKRVTETLGLPEFLPRSELWQQDFADYQYEATKEFQIFRGYNPSTQEFAKRHGLPLVDITWPDGKTGPGMCILSNYTTRFLIKPSSEGKHGSRSLMRAIDLARARRPYDDSIWLVVHLRQAAENAAMDVTEQNSNDLDLRPAAGCTYERDDAAIAGFVYMEAVLGKAPQDTPLIDFLRLHPSVIKSTTPRHHPSIQNHKPWVWLEPVRSEEIPELLSAKPPPSIEPFTWVRVNNGLYKDDVGLVVRRELSSGLRRLVVLLVQCRLRRLQPCLR